MNTVISSLVINNFDKEHKLKSEMFPNCLKSELSRLKKMSATTAQKH